MVWCAEISGVKVIFVTPLSYKVSRRTHSVFESNKQFCLTKEGGLKQQLLPSTLICSDFLRISPTSISIPLSVCNLSHQDVFCNHDDIFHQAGCIEGEQVHHVKC